MLDAHLVETLAHSLAVLVGNIFLTTHSDIELTELLVVIFGTLLELCIIGFTRTVCHKRLGILKPTTAEYTYITEQLRMHDRCIQSLYASHRQSCQCTPVSSSECAIAAFNERNAVGKQLRGEIL